MRTAAGGGVTPISTAVVTYERFSSNRVIVFRKFMTDDGHTWCAIYGDINGLVDIPDGYRPNTKSTIVFIANASSDTSVRTYDVAANAAAFDVGASSGSLGAVALVGDNIWQVS